MEFVFGNVHIEDGETIPFTFLQPMAAFEPKPIQRHANHHIIQKERHPRENSNDDVLLQINLHIVSALFPGCVRLPLMFSGGLDMVIIGHPHFSMALPELSQPIGPGSVVALHAIAPPLGGQQLVAL